MGNVTRIWARRAVLALIFGFSMLLWCALAQLAVEFVSMLLGELSEHAERAILLWSTVLWLPLAIGMVWRLTNPPILVQQDDSDTLHV